MAAPHVVTAPSSPHANIYMACAHYAALTSLGWGSKWSAMHKVDVDATAHKVDVHATARSMSSSKSLHTMPAAGGAALLAIPLNLSFFFYTT